MTRILTLDGSITDLTKPVLTTLESLEAQIAALTPRGWWDTSNPSYRTDLGGSGAVATGSSSGTALTLVSVSAGAVAVGQAVTGTGVTLGTYVVSGSGLNWVISPSQTIPASTVLNFAPTCSQVNDRSGNGLHFQQATQANRPPVAINTWNALNGVRRDSLSFNGSTDYKMSSLGTVFDSTTIWSMALICKAQDAARLAVPVSLPGANRFEFDNQSGALGWRANGQVSTILNAQTTNLLVMMTYNYPGSGNVTENMYVTDLGGTNFTRSVTYALGSTSPANSGLLLGTLGSNANFGFKGNISELFVFKADLSGNAPAIALLQQYFQMKYRVS